MGIVEFEMGDLLDDFIMRNKHKLNNDSFNIYYITNKSYLVGSSENILTHVYCAQ